MELRELLTDEWAYPLDLTGGDPVLDLCCADGDLSFFLESLGCSVTAVDLPQTNYNRMAGVRAMAFASPEGGYVVELLNSLREAVVVNLEFAGKVVGVDLPARSITTAVW